MRWLLTCSMTSAESRNRHTFPPHPFTSARTLLVLLVGFFTLVDTYSISPSHAIGPTLPLSFEDLPESRDPWVVDLLVDPEQIRVVRIERQVYADGERLWVEPIEVTYESPPVNDHVEARARLPLHFKEMEELKQRRVFAQKIIVEGQWLKEPAAKPLHLQRWFYFVAEGDTIRRVDLEEYSRFTDRAEADTNSRGRQSLVHRGRDLKTAIPLPETKGTPAISVGPLEGAMEERVPQEGKRPVQEMDRSEVDEK
jgi:hypothetical protein